MRIKFLTTCLGILMPLGSPSSQGEKGILGGLNALGGCIKGCREEDQKRSESSCVRFCSCALEFDSNDLLKWITEKKMGEAANCPAKESAVRITAEMEVTGCRSVE